MTDAQRGPQRQMRSAQVLLHWARLLASADLRGIIRSTPRVIFPIPTDQQLPQGRRLKRIILASLTLVAGCATTTGIIAAGKDQYMISREDNGPAASLGAIKAKAFQEASAFCAGQGKAMQIVKENDVPRSFGQFPQTSVQFTCV